jgi:uncharacterized membrane protein
LSDPSGIRPGPRESPAAAATPGSEGDQIRQNVSAVLEFYTREEQKISRSQRVLERISLLVGQPAFLGVTLVFVASWMLANTVMRIHGVAGFDPSPHHLLHGVISLAALLMATVVLIKQNRMSRLAEQRAHLDLKVMLLTEQKAAKMIDLLEELRRDMPNVRDRHDADAAAMQHAMNPDRVLAALDEGAEVDDRKNSASGPEGAGVKT